MNSNLNFCFTAEEVLLRLAQWDNDEDDTQGSDSDSARESQDDMDISDDSVARPSHDSNSDSDSDNGQPAPAQPAVPNRGRTAVRGPIRGLYSLYIPYFPLISCILFRTDMGNSATEIP